MYKSGRYYFARKTPGTAKPRSATKRPYIAASKGVLSSMDEHIESVRNSEDFRPAAAFERFAENTNLEAEYTALKEKGVPADQVRAKLKHTYKNRCFLLRRRAEAAMAPASSR